MCRESDIDRYNKADINMFRFKLTYFYIDIKIHYIYTYTHIYACE